MFIKTKPNICKLISLVTLWSFVLTQAAWAMPDGGLTIAPQLETPSFLQVEIPSDLASVEEIYEAPARENPKLILNIQNIHGNYESQVQISKLLQYLYERFGFKLLFAEGAAEKLNMDLLRLFPDAETNQKLADLMAKKGELTGIEYFMMNGPKDVEAVGIEKAELYRRNFEAFKKVYGAKPEVDQFLDLFEGRLETLSSRIFSPNTRRVLSEWRKFESGHRDFLPYIKNLAADAKTVLNLDLQSLFAQVEWPQITRLLALQSMEADLDRKAAERDRERLLVFLKERHISEKIIHAIETIDEKKISMSRDEAEARREDLPRYLFERLVDEAGPKGFQFHEFPAFSLWAGHLILQNELDSKLLFEEIEKVFTKILTEMTVSEREKNLMELTRDEILLKKLLHLEVTRSEWQRAVYRKDWLILSAMVGRLQKISDEISGELKLNSEDWERLQGLSGIESGKESLSSILETSFKFYEFARQRESIFFKTIDDTMNQKGIEKAVLVTGGFHTDGLMDMFRENEFNASILMPKISGDLDNSAYISTMMENKPSMFEIGTLEIAIRAQGLRTLRDMGIDIREGVAQLVAEVAEVGQISLEEAQALVAEKYGIVIGAQTEDGRTKLSVAMPPPDEKPVPVLEPVLTAEDRAENRTVAVYEGKKLESVMLGDQDKMRGVVSYLQTVGAIPAFDESLRAARVGPVTVTVDPSIQFLTGQSGQPFFSRSFPQNFFTGGTSRITENFSRQIFQDSKMNLFHPMGLQIDPDDMDDVRITVFAPQDGRIGIAVDLGDGYFDFALGNKAQPPMGADIMETGLSLNTINHPKTTVTRIPHSEDFGQWNIRSLDGRQWMVLYGNPNDDAARTDFRIIAQPSVNSSSEANIPSFDAMYKPLSVALARRTLRGNTPPEGFFTLREQPVNEVPGQVRYSVNWIGNSSETIPLSIVTEAVRVKRKDSALRVLSIGGEPLAGRSSQEIPNGSVVVFERAETREDEQKFSFVWVKDRRLLFPQISYAVQALLILKKKDGRRVFIKTHYDLNNSEDGGGGGEILWAGKDGTITAKDPGGNPNRQLQIDLREPQIKGVTIYTTRSEERSVVDLDGDYKNRAPVAYKSIKFDDLGGFLAAAIKELDKIKMFRVEEFVRVELPVSRDVEQQPLSKFLLLPDLKVNPEGDTELLAHVKNKLNSGKVQGPYDVLVYYGSRYDASGESAKLIHVIPSKMASGLARQVLGISEADERGTAFNGSDEEYRKHVRKQLETSPWLVQYGVTMEQVEVRIQERAKQPAGEPRKERAEQRSVLAAPSKRPAAAAEFSIREGKNGGAIIINTGALLINISDFSLVVGGKFIQWLPELEGALDQEVNRLSEADKEKLRTFPTDKFSENVKKSFDLVKSVLDKTAQPILLPGQTAVNPVAPLTETPEMSVTLGLETFNVLVGENGVSLTIAPDLITAILAGGLLENKARLQALADELIKLTSSSSEEINLNSLAGTVLAPTKEEARLLASVDMENLSPATLQSVKEFLALVLIPFSNTKITLVIVDSSLKRGQAPAADMVSLDPKIQEQIGDRLRVLRIPKEAVSGRLSQIRTRMLHPRGEKPVGDDRFVELHFVNDQSLLENLVTPTMTERNFATVVDPQAEQNEALKLIQGSFLIGLKVAAQTLKEQITDYITSKIGWGYGLFKNSAVLSLVQRKLDEALGALRAAVSA